MKQLIKKTPIIRSMARIVYFTIIAPFKSFPGSENYWKRRYKAGGNSGAGSYNKLAKFKAQIINDFIRDKQIKTVIEYGCGDGNQLIFAEYSSYIGFDVSPEVILRCKNIFSNDNTKLFKLMDDYSNETAQLTLSLDVIYHLVEDNVFFFYMNRLFDSSENFVIIYSSNTNKQSRLQAAYIKHRNFSDWIEQHKPDWKLIKHVPNRYPHPHDDFEGSFADFYIYKKVYSL